MNESRIGFLGIGQMGLPLARHLQKAGYCLHVYDPQRERVGLLEATGNVFVADRVADVVELGSLVFSMVPGERELYEIAEAILPRIGAGGVHISMSTVGYEATVSLAKLYRAQGSELVAANVLGRPDLVAAGQSSIYLSGNQQAKQRVLPLLSCMAKRVEDYGEDVGAANVVKTFFNFMIAVQLAALGQGAALLRNARLDPVTAIRSLIASGLIGGHVFEGYGMSMIGPNRYDDARFPASPLGEKDLRMIRATALALGVELPYNEIALDYLLAAIEQGLGQKDWSVLALTPQERAGVFMTEGA